MGGCVDHPLLLPPGQSVTFRHVLKGYRLTSGRYTLHATGKAGVRWFFGAGRGTSTVSDRKQGDPVEGALFDVSLKLIVRDGTEEELRQHYEPYLADSSRESKEAIAEMAPRFLEKTIFEFADQPDNASLAVEGLAQIPTESSRASLKWLFDKTADSNLRALIVEKLAGVATSAERPFFSGLLANSDSRVASYAAFGIARLGGDSAVTALETAVRVPDDEVRRHVAIALGNTRSAAAIPVLISMYGDEAVSNAVCGALATLTHRRWCDGSHSPEQTQRIWRRWYDGRASSLVLYGVGECLAHDSLPPLDDAP
jgi:hypothetical protein